MTAVRHRILLALALFVIACGGGGSGGGDDGSGDDVEMRSILVRWRASDAAAGYVVHWGRSSGAYTDALDVGAPAVDPDGVIEFFLDETGPGGTIYFALTSYDDEGRRSAFSNEFVRPRALSTRRGAQQITTHTLAVRRRPSLPAVILATAMLPTRSCMLRHAKRRGGGPTP